MSIRIALLMLIAACASSPVAPRSPPEKAAPPARAGDPAKPPAPPEDETLGQCLTRKGFRLYGASWCHPCHVQMEMFGDDAKNVPFTDCFPTDDTVIAVPACQAVGLEMTSAYPTWIFPDGLRVVGVRSLEWLAVSADCPLR